MASKMARALAVALATVPAFAVAEVALQVMGQSGKFKIYDAKAGASAGGITVTMDALTEVDSSGKEVGNTGAANAKHSINSFATTDFTVASPVNVSIGTANASRVDFEAAVGTIGKLKVETYLMWNNGTVGDDEWPVAKGDLKWNIVFPQWTFCAPCGTGNNAGTGAYLDLTITVQGLGTAAKQGNGNSTVNLGGGAKLMLASNVTIDGDATNMPSGYPAVVVQGSKTSVTFRFPKFSTNAEYDPLITASAATNLGGDASVSSALSNSAPGALMLLAVAMGMQA